MSPGLLAWMRLNACGVRPDHLRSLADRLGFERVMKAGVQEFVEAGLNPEAAERVAAFDAGREQEEALDLGLRVLACDEPDYPGSLRSIVDAPLVLYVWGTLDASRDGLAIVGTRRPTPYGRRMARRLAQEACSRMVIVSGLARGIDTEAHRAALEASGTTWAVLGSGLKTIYPPENAGLAHEIVSAGGCLLSEFPLDTQPLPGNFPRRNRIVAGLSWGTVVVEGLDKSGSLITARLACEQGRQVFAVPGPADSPLSDAPFRLITQGAQLIRSMADVWPDLPPGCQTRAEAVPISAAHKKILELLGSETRSLEELGCGSGLDVPQLSQALIEMELEDLVQAVPGQRYAKKGN